MNRICPPIHILHITYPQSLEIMFINTFLERPYEVGTLRNFTHIDSMARTFIEENQSGIWDNDTKFLWEQMSCW